MLQHLVPSGASQAQVTCPVTSISWSRGVTVSTLDSESSDRGSNPRGTSCPLRLLSFPAASFFFHFLPAAIFYSCHLAAWQQALHSMLVACLLASTVLLSSFLHAVQPILLSPLCYFEGPRKKYLFAQHTNSSRLMQLGGSTRRKTSAGGTHTRSKLVALQGLLMETEPTQGQSAKSSS